MQVYADAGMAQNVLHTSLVHHSSGSAADMLIPNQGTFSFNNGKLCGSRVSVILIRAYPTHKPAAQAVRDLRRVAKSPDYITFCIEF